MPVAVAMPSGQDKKDPLDAIEQALGIIGAVHGIHVDRKMLEQKKAERDELRGRQGLEDKQRGLEIQKLERESAAASEDDNPNSPLVAEARRKLKTRGITLPEGATMRQVRTNFDAFLKPNDPKQRDPMADELVRGRLDEQKRKRDEEEQALHTNYGKARTKDDAKQLKEASELKSKLDAEISELIAIRQEYGGEAMNRNVVGRAQQLSKSLLLTKKNMEKLGVLSKSDEAIVDEIIPSDPTQFHLVGDPTMTKLKAFKADTERDFQARIANRIRDGQAPAGPGGADGLGLSAGGGAPPKPKTVMQNGHVYTLNPKTGQYE